MFKLQMQSILEGQKHRTDQGSNALLVILKLDKDPKMGGDFPSWPFD